MATLTTQKISDYPEELQNYFHQMSISSEFEIIGSSHYKNFLYSNDYDLNEYYKAKDTPQVLNKLHNNFLEMFEEAQKNPNQYITDFKCGKIGEEPIRWNYENLKNGYQKINNKKYLFTECLLMDSTIKLDEVVFINGLASEITNNYFLKIGSKGNSKKNTKNEIIKMLKQNYEECIEEKKYFKALKRKFSIYQIRHPNKIPKTLLSILNSNSGRLYKTVNDLKLIILLLELKGRKPNHEMIINNLQSIKYYASKITKYKLDFLSNEIDRICEMKSEKNMIHQLEILADKLNNMLNNDVKDKI